MIEPDRGLGRGYELITSGFFLDQRRFCLVAKVSKRSEKAGETRETAEIIYDALETSLVGNPIDANSL